MIADLVGKGGHVRTVPVPAWVKKLVDAWTAAAAITHGAVFRAINKAGRVWGEGMSPRLDPDDRALPPMQAEAPGGRERPVGNRT